MGIAALLNDSETVNGELPTVNPLLFSYYLGMNRTPRSHRSELFASP